MNAIYVSIWDEDIKISSSCKIDLSTKEVTDVEQINVEELDLNFVTEEFIELPDGSLIKDFILDGTKYENGLQTEEF